MGRAGPSGKKEMNKHLLRDLLRLDRGKKKQAHYYYTLCMSHISFKNTVALFSTIHWVHWVAKNHSKQTLTHRKFNKSWAILSVFSHVSFRKSMAPISLGDVSERHITETTPQSAVTEMRPSSEQCWSSWWPWICISHVASHLSLSQEAKGLNIDP